MRGLLTLLVLLASLAPAAEPDKLVFALRPLPPYMEVTPTGFTGAHVEIMQRLAARLKVKLEIVECPLIRCLRMLQDGSADMTMGLAMNAEREPIFVLLQPAYATGSPTYFYVRSNEDRPLRNYQDLYEFRIGVTRGVRYFDEFDTDPKLQKDEAPNQEASFRKLIAGRLDVVPVGANVAASIVADPQFAGRIKPAEWVRPNKILRQAALSKVSAWFAYKPQIEAALAAMVNAGETRVILERYEAARDGACRAAKRC